MQIGELAKGSGLTASRIRFYEERGLIAATRGANGYRAYGSDALVTLNIITAAQRAGFRLDEIRGLMPSKDVDWDTDALLDSLQRKLDENRALQQRLAASCLEIESLMAAIQGKPDDVSCADNVERVLTRFETTS